MVSEKPSYLVNLISQGVGRVVSTAVSFLVFILVARHLGAETFGKFSYIVSFWAIMTVFAEFGTQTVLAKDIAQISKEKAPVYFGNYLLLRGILCLAVAVLAVTASAFIRQDLFLYILGGCLLLPVLSWRFYDPIFQVYQKPWNSATAASIFSAVYLVVMLWAVFLEKSLGAVVTAYLAANTIYTLILVKMAATIIRPRMGWDSSVIKDMLKLSIPMGIASVYTIVNSKADIFLLAYLKSDAAVGLYNAAYRFLDLAAVFIATMTMPLIPMFARWYAADKKVFKDNYARIMELMTVMAVPIAIIVPFISRDVMRVCFGSEFIESAGVLNILVWVGVLVAYSLVSSIVNLVVEDIRHSYWNGAIAASLNICLNSLWIPRYGFIGASWATLISEIAILSVCLYHVFKNLGNFIDGKKWLVIVAVNVAFFVLLEVTKNYGSAVVMTLLALAVYAVMIFVFKVVSWQEIKNLLPGRLQKEVIVP
jgi:O-antigen/teichoic acid export membrane protein